MPDYSSDTAVMRLFRQRNAQRQGQQLSGEDATQFGALAKWGQDNLGVAATPMPGRPVESRGPSGPSSGDALSSMAPPGGDLPMGKTDHMQARAGAANPAASTTPGPGVRGNGLLQRRSIPALDALNDAPKKRNRGLIHRRDVGRVM